MNQNTPKSASRRKVLATTGSMAGLASIPMITSADTDFDTIYKESLKLRRRNNWSADRWRQHLREQDDDGSVTVKEKQFSKRIEPKEDNQVGPNHISDKENLELDCTLIGNGSNAWADMQFEANDSIWELGKDPADGLAFGWDWDEYDFDGNSYNGWYASDTSLVDIRQYTGNGVSFSFKDKGHVQDGHWVSVDLLVEGGTPSTRNVIFSYMHTWDDTVLKSVSVSTSGIVKVTLEDQTDKWDSPVQDQLFEA